MPNWKPSRGRIKTNEQRKAKAPVSTTDWSKRISAPENPDWSVRMKSTRVDTSGISPAAYGAPSMTVMEAELAMASDLNTERYQSPKGDHWLRVGDSWWVWAPTLGRWFQQKQAPVKH